MKQLTGAYGQLEQVRLFHDGIPGFEDRRLEAALHWHYARHRIAPPRCLEKRSSGDTEWFEEAVLDSIRELDPKPILKAHKDTRSYELRLDRGDVEALKRAGMTIADAVARVAAELRGSAASPTALMPPKPRVATGSTYAANSGEKRLLRLACRGPE